MSFINGQELFFTHYSFHGLFIGKVTEEWKALQCVFYRMLTEFCAVPLDALTRIYLSGNRFQTDCRFSLATRLSDSIGVVAPTGQQPEEVSLRAYGPFADYLRKHPFHHSQVERNDMGTFTSFDYMLLVTDELVDEILALGDKVEITFPENLRMKLLQKIGRIRDRYAT